MVMGQEKGQRWLKRMLPRLRERDRAVVLPSPRETTAVPSLPSLLTLALPDASTAPSLLTRDAASERSPRPWSTGSRCLPRWNCPHNRLPTWWPSPLIALFSRPGPCLPPIKATGTQIATSLHQRPVTPNTRFRC